MVTQDMLDELEIGSVEEFYDYIVDSRTNGQHRQSHELFAMLSRDQKERFYVYVEANDLDRQEGQEQPFRQYLERG